MASFEVIGFINNVVYRQESVYLFLDEYHKGFRKKNGIKTDDKYVTFKITFKPYFKKYLSENFANGMLVKVKGEVLPYAVEHGKTVDGITMFGETCNMFSYPRSTVKNEIKMIRDSQEGIGELPDVSEALKPDF